MYEPYPIVDMRTGLFEAREPFLAPRDAAVELRNGFVFRGRLMKRTGHTRIGILGTSEEITGETSPVYPAGMHPVQLQTNVLLPESPPSTYQLRVTDGTQILYDPGPLYATSTLFTNEAVDGFNPPSAQVAGTLSRAYAQPGTVGFIFLGQSVQDDGRGVLLDVTSQTAIGSIDYERSEYFMTLLTAPGIDDPDPSVLYAYPEFPEQNVMHQDFAAVGLTLNSGNRYTGSFTLEIQKYSVTLTDGTLTAIDDGNGNLVGDVDPGGTNTINYTTGAYDVTFSGAVTSPTGAFKFVCGRIDHPTGQLLYHYGKAGPGPSTITYEYNRGLPVCGIQAYFDLSENEHFVALDTRRLWEWNSTERRFYDVQKADVFTGGQDDHFWLWPFDNILTINNNIDPPYKFESGVGLNPMGNQWGGGGDLIEQARIFIRDPRADRGVYLAPTENGTQRLQRARFTQIGAPESFDSPDRWIDAPTNDAIVSAAIMGGNIYVLFRRSVWRLRWLQDDENPYEWERLPAKTGSEAKLGNVPMTQEIFYHAQTSLSVLDDNGQVDIDKSVPDIAVSWNKGKANLSQFHRNDEYRQLWLSHVSAQSDTQDEVLTIQYDEDGQFSYSVADLAFNYWHYWRREGGELWDDLDDLWDNYDFPTWDSGQATTGFPVSVAGNYQSEIFAFGREQLTDNGVPIAFDWFSKRLNPFPGFRAVLGFIEIWMDAVKRDEELNVSIYCNYESSRYLTRAVKIMGDGVQKKIVRRVPVFKEANFHQIRLEHNGIEPIRIDAIIPHFMQGGQIQELG